ncbi:UNVERIFIED_CONTAM: cohesin domain-containing protein [Acetivibrio alkalicellulosi]
MLKKYSVLIFVIFIGLTLILSSCQSKNDKDSSDKNPTTSVDELDSTKQEEQSKSNNEQKDNDSKVGNEDLTDSNGSNDNDGNVNTGNDNTGDKTPIESGNTVTIPSSNNYIQIKLDKNSGEIGEIIKADIVLKSINGIAGYQVNIKYDPKVLQAVNYDTGEPLGNRTIPSGGTMIQNEAYNVLPLPGNNIEQGIINFGKTYVNLNAYKESGSLEKEGTFATIGFKILEKTSTSIRFEDIGTMPTAISGTMLFDLNGERISGYQIVQSETIN